MIVLGIETSCDETAAAVIRREGDARGTILSNVVLSQTDEHAAFGGVVPEIAARAHVEALDHIIKAALDEAGYSLRSIDGIAATAGPGLIGGVIVGMMTAKAMAQASSKPFLAINHLEGHALTVRLTDGLAFPYLLLLVSGGHTQIQLVTGLGAYERWGTTIDDALGEAFDKTAKLLSLDYPGGPAVEQQALRGVAGRFSFPKPLLNKPGLDFSFSGLKTAVRYTAEDLEPVSEQDISDICAGFQHTVTEILSNRMDRALQQFRHRFPDVAQPCLVVAGGVAANTAIRQALETVTDDHGARLVVPPAALCTDNAVMIAWAGAERLAQGETHPLDTAPRSRWPLDEQAPAKLGHGRAGTKV